MFITAELSAHDMFPYSAFTGPPAKCSILLRSLPFRWCACFAALLTYVMRCEPIHINNSLLGFLQCRKKTKLQKTSIAYVLGFLQLQIIPSKFF